MLAIAEDEPAKPNTENYVLDEIGKMVDRWTLTAASAGAAAGGLIATSHETVKLGIETVFQNPNLLTSRIGISALVVGTTAGLIGNILANTRALVLLHNQPEIKP